MLWHYQHYQQRVLSWFVKGYIAEEKGINIKWAKPTTSTTRKKLRKEEITKWK
jgi:hypothetical protein